MKKPFLQLAGCVFLLAVNASGEVRLSSPMSDHMVVQRDMPLPVRGTAAPGEPVKVEFAGQVKTTSGGADGRWQVLLDPLPAGNEPLALTVNSSPVVTDVLIGDVWLCSGQSNMAFAMNGLKGTPYEGDLAKADFPLIRHGSVPRNASVTPVDETKVTWSVCTPQTVGDFTAAGFYFAKELQKEIKVPIGLLHASWGGTSAESWTSREALATVPDFKERADEQMANLEKLPELIDSFPSAISEWEKRNGREDSENKGEKDGWAAPATVTTDWKPADLPVNWNKAGLPNGGIIWLRKDVDVPASGRSAGFRLDLGMVDEQYVTAYWNGVKIGESGRKKPRFYYGYQYFDVPAGLIKPGRNVLALRFTANVGNKSSGGKGAAAWGLNALGGGNVDEHCVVKVEREFAPLSADALKAMPPVPKGDASHTSSALYGGMIHPLVSFPVKGCLWYQGEQDAGRAFAYRTLLPLMIRDWRGRWGQGDFPFIIQQLPNWKASGAGHTEWAEMREAQALTARNVPHCHLSVGIDIGESDNVHPRNKREIGRRLALVALADVYGARVEASGPVFESMAVEGAVVRVRFQHADGLKTSDGAALKSFQIAGEDQKFETAEAGIEGSMVVVSSPSVAKPVAVRYSFENDPPSCHLVNASGLPAMPFRSDSWPCSTDKRK